MDYRDYAKQQLSDVEGMVDLVYTDIPWNVLTPRDTKSTSRRTSGALASDRVREYTDLSVLMFVHSSMRPIFSHCVTSSEGH